MFQEQTDWHPNFWNPTTPPLHVFIFGFQKFIPEIHAHILKNIKYGAGQLRTKSRISPPASPHSPPRLCCAVLSRSVMSNSATPWMQPTRLLCPWGFFRQEYWSGLPCPPPGDLPNPGIKSSSPALQTDALPSTRETHLKGST